MTDKLYNWITTGEPRLPSFIVPFAKAAPSGGDDDDDDDEDDDDDDDEDDLADLTDEELRTELKSARDSLSKAGGSVKSKRDKIKKLTRELDEARKPKPAKKPKNDDGDTDAPDVDSIRHEARVEGEKAGIARAKKAEAKSALLAAGANPARVNAALNTIDLTDVDLDDDGLDGIEDLIEVTRKEYPEYFAKKRVKRESTSGQNDRNGDGGTERKGGRTTKTASEVAAERILGRS